MEIINKLNLGIISKMFLAFVIITSTFTACDDEDSGLPDVGGIEDSTPPLSEFTPIRSDIDPLVYNFKNNTRSFTEALWSIPDNATVINEDADITEPLKEEDITVRFPDFGSYEVSLTTSDKNNATSTVSQTVEVVKPLLDPPNPGFSFELKNADFTILDFVNESSNTARIIWVLPTGATLYDADPSDGVTPSLSDDMIQIKFPGEGTYDVTLKAFNAVDDEEEITKSVEVSKAIAPTPTILEPGFDMGNDSRDPWRASTYLAFNLGGVIQITTSPVQMGTHAAKFPSAGDRVGYQEFAVTPNTDYTLTYYYTLKTSPVGSVTVSILGGGGFADQAAVNAAVIASNTGSDQSSASSYVKVDLPFNSGANTTAAIYVTNMGAEARVDSFSITVN